MNKNIYRLLYNNISNKNLWQSLLVLSFKDNGSGSFKVNVVFPLRIASLLTTTAGIYVGKVWK